jgi:hypothetical protein
MPSMIFLSVSSIDDPGFSSDARNFQFDEFLHGSQEKTVGLGDTIQVSVARSISNNYYPSLVSIKQHPYTFYCTVKCIYGFSLTHVAFTLERMSTMFQQTLYVPRNFSRLSVGHRALGLLITLPRRCWGAHKSIFAPCDVTPVLHTSTSKNVKSAHRRVA